MSRSPSPLENFGLGMDRDLTVTLLPHDARWAPAGLFESARLADAINIEGLAIYHVGSTAIPGIHAKPILDLLLTVPDLAGLDQKRVAVESLGYEWKGEYGIPGRRYCVLYDEAKSRSYAHLHAFRADGEEIRKHLLFRDYLRAHPSAAKEYEELKLSLQKDPAVSRANYSDRKGPLVMRLITEAEAWRR